MMEIDGGKASDKFKSPRAYPSAVGKIRPARMVEQERGKLTKAGIPNFLQPLINSMFPPQFEVMNTTSAFHSLYIAATSPTMSGLPPRSFESHSNKRSGGMFLWIREAMVGPKVFS